ncbi:hypothetical protein L327_12810 [Yersinia pestis S3]|nr:hypothetical protein L327_12810 [Yersinia pestis S3]ERP82301.1 hypothetical protein L325_12735 [Yersinia pestis 9]
MWPQPKADDQEGQQKEGHQDILQQAFGCH